MRELQTNQNGFGILVQGPTILEVAEPRSNLPPLSLYRALSVPCKALARNKLPC